MVTSVFRVMCVGFIVMGLALVYTLFYGGPFAPFFAWLAHQLPGAVQINLNPAPLNH